MTQAGRIQTPRATGRGSSSVKVHFHDCPAPFARAFTTPCSCFRQNFACAYQHYCAGLLLLFFFHSTATRSDDSATVLDSATLSSLRATFDKFTRKIKNVYGVGAFAGAASTATAAKSAAAALRVVVIVN